MKLRTRGMFSVGRLRRALGDRLRGTPFDRALARARNSERHDFVFAWNRGLGDVALGLVPLFARIRHRCKDSRIIVVTRSDLAEMTALTAADAVIVVDGLQRGQALDPLREAQAQGIVFRNPPTVFADPDPTRWIDGRRADFPPRLAWDTSLDARARRFADAAGGRVVVGAHVNSETAQYYGYVKDWPASSWRALIERFPAARGVHWLLFGNEADGQFDFANVTDLRGQTSLLELLALVRTRCRILLAPDSGILTAMYYLDQQQPIDVISLWSDPRQGILKQGCASPNRALRHTPLLGRGEDVRALAVEDVEGVLATRLSTILDSSPPEARHAP